MPNGYTGTIFRTREYGEGACFLFLCGLLNGFMGTIFRTREYVGYFLLFFLEAAPNGYTGTIFRTREYGGVVFVLFLECVLLPMASWVRFFVPVNMRRVSVSFFLVCGLLNGFIGTIFRTREYEEMLGSLEVGCGVGKKQWVRRNRTHYL